jgi:hypothetical protein
MPTLAIEGGELVVHLSLVEKLAAIHGDARFRLATVTDVAVEPNVWSALRGIRAPGSGVPYLLAYGTRRWPGGKVWRSCAAGSGRGCGSTSATVRRTPASS